ncbi:hypothetical protein SVIOM342S_06061 [Streptomyces violaceorubidus]
MLDDVGTSCATTNATPETSSPHATVWMPHRPEPETGRSPHGDAFDTVEHAPNAPEHSP